MVCIFIINYIYIVKGKSLIDEFSSNIYLHKLNLRNHNAPFFPHDVLNIMYYFMCRIYWCGYGGGDNSALSYAAPLN